MPVLRVVVAVSPQLLSDAVRRTLNLDGIPSDEITLQLPEPADVAIVTVGREAQVRARTVITLAPDAPREAAMDHAGKISDINVTSLEQLREALAVCLHRESD